MFNIVLVEPEIPQNTGNIVRTCAATGCRLHLIRPLGFEVSDKYLKRAGLDYWNDCDFLVFGKESKGLPEELLMDNRDTCLRIPMIGETRSLNLSNSVAVAVYEGLRQLDFDGFKTEGQLHKHKW